MESDDYFWGFGGDHGFAPYSLMSPGSYGIAGEFPSPGSSTAFHHSELLGQNEFQHDPAITSPVSPMGGYRPSYSPNEASLWVLPEICPVNQLPGVCPAGTAIPSAEPPSIHVNDSGLLSAGTPVTPRRGSASAGYSQPNRMAEFDTRRRMSAPSVRAQLDVPQRTSRSSPARTRKWGKDDQEEMRRMAEGLETRNASLVTERERLEQQKSELMEQLFKHSWCCDKRINDYLTCAAEHL